MTNTNAIALNQSHFSMFSESEMYKHFLNIGYKIIALYPINETNKCGCGKSDCSAIGKHPAFPNWQATKAYTDEQLTVLENEGFLSTGYGVLMDGLLVIDIDERNGGDKSFAKLLNDVPEIKKAGLVVKTGSGGKSRHYYFKVSSTSKLDSHLKQYPGIDFKSSGFVVGPGSLHKSGNRYEILSGSPYDIAETPLELLAILQEEKPKQKPNDNLSDSASYKQIEELLFYIPADCGYEQWIRIGMAIHYETHGEGFDLWDKWSSEGKKYKGSQDLRAHWNSFGDKHNNVTLGTLIHYAKENGYIGEVNVDIDPFRTLNSFAMTSEKREAFKNTQYIIDGLIVEKYHTYITGPAGGGKTTVFLHLGFEIAKKGYKVIFFYLDGALSMAADVHAEIEVRKLDNQYKLLIDGTIGEYKTIMEACVTNKMDLSKTVFILDTFKFLTSDINNKRSNQKAMHLIKNLRSLGATFVSLGHNNKDGERYSGTAEIEQDCDALLKIEAHEEDGLMISTISKGGRCRCEIEEKSFQYAPGDVLSVESVNPSDFEDKQLQKLENQDNHFIEYIQELLKLNPDMIQKDLIDSLTQTFGLSKGKAQKLVDRYLDKYWFKKRADKVPNGYCYFVN